MLDWRKILFYLGLCCLVFICFAQNNDIEIYRELEKNYSLFERIDFAHKKDLCKKNMQNKLKEKKFKLFDNYLDSIFVWEMDYLKYKYYFQDIDLSTFKESYKKDLFSSGYFKRYKDKFSDKDLIYYHIFRIEWWFLKLYKSNFKFDVFKQGVLYQNMIDSLSEYSIVDINNMMKQVKIVDYTPLHYYYRPQSVKQQVEVNKLDLSKVNFETLSDYCHRYQKYLKKSFLNFDVNPEIIIAILDRETRLGNVSLKYNPFSVLLALSEGYIIHPLYEFEEFSKQLKRAWRIKKYSQKNLLKMAKYSLDNKLPISSLKSNFVGALGFVQFMPFNLNLAIDGDGDGIADLSNHPDAILSIGSFFKNNHWLSKKELTEENRGFFIRQILKYNKNSSYAEAVFEIALELKKRLNIDFKK